MNIPKEIQVGRWGIPPKSDAFHASSDATLFSSSLPVLPHAKLNSNGSEHVLQSVDDLSSDLHKLHQHVEGNDLLEVNEIHAIGSLLPDDEEELLAGLMDDFDLSGLPSQVEELDEYDLFGSGGGMELENDLPDNLNLGMSKVCIQDSVGNGAMVFGLPSGAGSVAGEHPYGEHPSRTLFVRNINSNVEDSELRALFEQYGDIRTLYTACKHRGFVMISYYDIRAARTAMRALQNKPLRRRKLDIHFSIPKDNPSDKDINQGTLVVFNLDPSVSNDDLRQIFGAYGEVKEIRETPHKRHHKFIEYYDVRAAEAALKTLNRSDIAGKRIKLEPSRPGGARRNLMLQLNQDLELDETKSFRHHVGSPVTNSPPGSWAQFNSPIESSPLQGLSKSPVFETMNTANGNNLPGLASILHPHVSNSVKVAPIGKDHINRTSNHMEHIFTNSNTTTFQHSSHFYHEPKLNQFSGPVSSFGASSTSNGSGIETLSGPQFLWGSPNTYPELTNAPAWARQIKPNGQAHGFSHSNRPGSFLGSCQTQQHYHHHHHHHVGSAPPGIPLERHFSYVPDSANSIAGFGGIGLARNDASFMTGLGGRAAMSPGIAIQGNMSENGVPGFAMISSPRLSPIFVGNGPYTGISPSSLENLMERGRPRRVENNGNQIDIKKQFQLDLEKIINGEDTRTTLMIKNIPNKYTSKMLLAAIDENHRGTYDFLYLPIDFKNKCNVGYAFINMLSPSHIIPFYQALDGKKWEKFNSEKVASLAYARIQGKAALVTHFQNSSLMNEDKRCRPILFHSEGPEAGEQIIQEHLPSNSLNIQIHHSNGLSISVDPTGNPTEEGNSAVIKS